MIKRYNANCWDILKEMPDNSVQLIATDPPYFDKIDMDELNRVVGNGNIVMFCSPMNHFFVPQYLSEWIKPAAPKNTINRISQSNIEHILISRGRDGAYNGNELFWSNMTGTYNDVYYDTLLFKGEHPFEKPRTLWEKLIALYSNPGDTVLDPFMGTGSSMRACQILGRNGIGIEISEKWYKLSNDLDEPLMTEKQWRMLYKNEWEKK